MENKAMDSKAIVYQSRDGQEIKLSFDLIKRYLVQGKRELVNEQEMMYFLAVCKSRGLNPFKRDAYLIKYTEGDPAAVVTSIDYFRSRAKAQKDCKGWQCGIIVKTKDGQVRYSNGLILEDETLIGGWFSARPGGWDEPLHLEVNLNGYIKKTRDGAITKFWTEEKQPTMIAKVAEAQGLRKVWPDEFQGIYEEEEIKAGQTITADYEALSNGKGEGQAFDKRIPDGTDRELLHTFLAEVAEGNGCDIDTIKADAVKDFDNFMKQFNTWCKKQKPKGKEKKAEAKEEKEKPKEETKTKSPIPQTPDDFREMSESEQVEVLNNLIAAVHYDTKKLKKPVAKYSAGEREVLFLELGTKYESMAS